MVTGLVGKSCAGKDIAADYFASKGIAVVDVDALGHEALAANVDRIVEAFGPEVLDGNGAVDRKRLGAMVFSDRDRLERLDGISHPWMRERVVSFVAAHPVCMINCALLEKMDLVGLCDEILFFHAPLEVRTRRAIKRDGISQEAFLMRDRSQKDIGSTLFECGKRVVTILNDSDLEHLYRQLEFYYDTLIGRGYVHG